MPRWADMIEYRREIDGLRAFAVIAVVIFHAGFAFVPGGYLGVDIFFVLSGYLITRIILKEQDEGSFSLVGFYYRRARRIMPALFVTSLATVPFALYLLAPNQLAHFGESLVGTAFFVSNWVFYRAGGYFGNSSELDPLIHYWSLSVEEQFYIFFPLLLLFSRRFLSSRSAGLVLVLLFLASLGVSEWASYTKPQANFFLLPTRIWELAAGAVCALHHHRSGRQRQPVLALIGMGMMLASVLVFDEFTRAPSLIALIPIGGVLLLLLFADDQSLLGRLLSWRPVVWCGLVSYSAYLIHQPVFAYLRISQGELSGPLAVGAIIGVFALAHLSWRFVEQPFRGSRGVLGGLSRKAVLGLAAIALAVLAVLGWIFATWSDQLTQFSPDQRALLNFETYPQHEALYGVGRCMVLADDATTQFADDCVPQDADYLVWGDSHAAAVSVGFLALAPNSGRITASSCPPIRESLSTRNVRCTELNEAVFATIAEVRPKTIVLMANWSGYIDDPRVVGQLESTIDQLTRALPETRIVILGSVPQWKPSLPRALLPVENALSSERRLEVEALQYRRLRSADEVLVQVASAREQVRFQSILDLICEGNSCLAVVERDGRIEPLIWDSAHLTELGSLRVAEEYLALEAERD